MRLIYATLLLAACGQDPSGVWLLETPRGADGSACDDQHGENFVYGQFPSDDDSTVQSDWTYTDESTYGDALAFAQIETMGQDEAVLVLDGTVIPGAWNKKAKQWTFLWTDEESSTSGESHVAGYSYTEVAQTSTSLEVRMTMIDDDHASGSIENTSVGRTTWTESDAWDAETVGVSYTQIPITTYLEAVDETAVLDNGSTTTDCEDADCDLWIQTTCTLDEDFTATRTDYEDEDVYGSLEGVTQPGS